MTNANVSADSTAQTFVPGETATGLVINLDSATQMYNIRLLKGARGYLSAYEVPDHEFDRLFVGYPVAGIVDRVETDKDGNVHVILKRETPPFIAL